MDSYFYMYFAFYLMNVLSWLLVGFLLGMRIHSLKRWQFNKKRFLFMATAAGFVGGLLADLSNGSPDSGISLINLLVAGFASFLAIYLTFPRYAELFIEQLKNSEIGFLSQLRSRLHTLNKK